MDKNNLIIFASALSIILLSVFSYTLIPKLQITTKEQFWPLTPIYNEGVSIPDPDKLDIVPMETIDTSGWLTYSNQKIGFEFKYPPEWGEYEEYYKDDVGRSFDLSFENSDFMVGGISKEFESQIAACDYTCFSGENNMESYCNYDDSLECTASVDEVIYKTLYPCEGSPDGGEQYMLVYLRNTPNSGYVDGLGFGGTWARSDSPLWKWRSCEREDLKKIKKIINQRRYDQGSVHTLDSYKKVIESIKLLTN